MNLKKIVAIILDVLFIIVQSVLLLMSFLHTKDLSKLEGGLSSICLGSYVFIWGLFFLISYFYPDLNYVTKALTWFCNISRGNLGKNTPIFYFVLAFILGGIALIVGFGIF